MIGSWVINIWSVLGPILVFASSVAGLFGFYWTIRLAVRHGIEDARRRRDQHSENEAGWGAAGL